MRRYADLLILQLRSSLLVAMQYRADFVLDAFVELVWASTALVPLLVAFGARERIAGWSFGEALLVSGWFLLLEAIRDGLIAPSLTLALEHIRKGTLDFVLVKPADAQFLVSTSRILPWQTINVVTALGIFVVAFRRLGTVPPLGGVLTAALLTMSGVVILYSFWILAVAAAFFLVRIDNLTFLFNAVFDAARWPRSVYRGTLRILFTFVIPLALMTSFPAEALLGRLSAGKVVGAIAGGALFALVSRLAWLRALRSYRSASS